MATFSIHGFYVYTFMQVHSCFLRSVDARSEIHESYISFVHLVILSRRESPTKREWNNEAGETSEER